MIFQEFIKAKNVLFCFAEVTGIETKQETATDGTYQNMPTGNLIVKMFDSGIEIKVMYLVPCSGRSMFMGGIPEIGSVAMLINVADDNINASYVAIGFLPIPINLMVAARKEMTSSTIEPGEIYVQASTSSFGDHWRGANAKWDIYGRLVIYSGDDSFKITVGDMLSGEYTETTTVIKDEITGQNVCYEERYADNSTRVDREGNIIHRWQRILEQIAIDKLSVIKGRYIVTTGAEIKHECLGSYISINPANGIEIKTLRDLSAIVSGTASIDTYGALTMSCMLDMVFMATGNYQLKCIADVLMTAANYSIAASKLYSVSAGTVNIAAALSATVSGNTGVDILSSAGLIRLKDITAAQPVPKGLELLTWLMTPTNHLDSLGFPIIHPVPYTTANLSEQVLVP